MTEPTAVQFPILFADRYRLENVAGSGGMSTVYRAYDTVLRRLVAIKILQQSAHDPMIGVREQTEIRASASLNHHSLVTLYEADVALFEGVQTTYLVMEFIDGPTLAARVRQGAVAGPEVKSWAQDLSEALIVIHNSGVVHRDVKPANILLASSLIPGRHFAAKLTDFGIASLLEATRITSTGTVIGTAAYLSPEQARGAAVGAASDIYSLGLVLLETLTGTPAFEGTMIETLSARLHSDPAIPTEIGPEWLALLTSMTRRDPRDRPTAVELVGLLDQMDSPAASPPPGSYRPTEPTALMDAPTRVMPSGQPARKATAPTVARHPRRKVAALMIAIALIIAGVIVAVSLSVARAPSPADTGSPSPAISSSPAVSASSVPQASATPSLTPVAPAAPTPKPGKSNGHGNDKGNKNNG